MRAVNERQELWLWYRAIPYPTMCLGSGYDTSHCASNGSGLNRTGSISIIVQNQGLMYNGLDWSVFDEDFLHQKKVLCQGWDEFAQNLF